jgi:hypothetical protein
VPLSCLWITVLLGKLPNWAAGLYCVLEDCGSLRFAYSMIPIRASVRTRIDSREYNLIRPEREVGLRWSETEH